MATDTITVSSDAVIIDPTIFTYADVTDATGNVVSNFTAFDAKLKHTCNHTLSTGKYTLGKCPRCLGIGYYYDICFNEAGKILEVSTVDKLTQTLEKFVITESNDFHPEVAINVPQYLGESPISEIKGVIKFELSKSLMELMNAQRGVPNLAGDAQISSIDSIEIYEDPADPESLDYAVTITTIAGSIKELTGTVILSG